MFYDDIDPNALSNGIVEIDGRRLGDLWVHCRKTRRCVVADVHVHPGHFRQSVSDRANPIIAEVGHMAIILPDFVERETRPGGIGVYEYLGSRNWKDRSLRSQDRTVDHDNGSRHRPRRATQPESLPIGSTCRGPCVRHEDARAGRDVIKNADGHRAKCIRQCLRAMLWLRPSGLSPVKCGLSRPQGNRLSGITQVVSSE